MNSNKLNDFEISKYLDSKEMIAEYLSQILADGDLNELLGAIKDIAKAKGMDKENYNKIFSQNREPKFDLIIQILNSFGIKLQAVA